MDFARPVWRLNLGRYSFEELRSSRCRDGTRRHSNREWRTGYSGQSAEAPSIAKAKTSLEPRLATYKKAPSGDTVTAVGVVPAGNGDPLTAATAPVVAFTV